MEGADVVVLEIDLDERLPVDRVLMGHHAVEHVAGKVEIGENPQAGEVASWTAWPRELQAIPLLQYGFAQIQTGIARKVRGAKQLAGQVVSPAMQRADDVLRVATALQHDRLAVAAHVRKQLHAALVAHQHLGVMHPVE